MNKVLIALVIGLGVLIAQPIPSHNRCPVPCENVKMEKPDCVVSMDNEMTNPPDFMCKQNPQEMVETIRIYKMSEELNLSQDQSVKFFPKLKEMRLAKEEFNQTRFKIAEQMEKFLQDSDKFSKEIKALVAELEANELKLREKEARIKKEIGNILTPEQQAKFMLFQMQFNKEMREMVGKAKKFHKEFQDQKPKKWRIY